MAESDDDEDGFGGFGDDAASGDKAADEGWATDFGEPSTVDQEKAKDALTIDVEEVKADEKKNNANEE